jgi:hypothetical protein
MVIEASQIVLMQSLQSKFSEVNKERDADGRGGLADE